MGDESDGGRRPELARTPVNVKTYSLALRGGRVLLGGREAEGNLSDA